MSRTAAIHGVAPVAGAEQVRAGSAGARVRGFTLVELMVVLFLIGIAAAAVVMTVPAGDPLGDQADAFATGLARARDEAILGTRTIEVTVTPQGYGFTRQHFGDWQPLRERPFGNRLWDERTQPQLPRGRDQISFRFDPTGAAVPNSLTLTHDRASIEIRVDAAGKVRMDARR